MKRFAGDAGGPDLAGERSEHSGRPKDREASAGKAVSSMPMLSQTIPQDRRAVGQALDFLRRQPRNFNLIVGRAAFSNFLMGLTSPYESIYVVALGATTVQLGLVNSVGNAASALIALPAGWLVNRFGVKRYFLLGMALLAVATLIFARAPTWQWIAGGGVGGRLSPGRARGPRAAGAEHPRPLARAVPAADRPPRRTEAAAHPLRGGQGACRKLVSGPEIAGAADDD